MPDREIRIRDGVGRAIFTAGSTLTRLGGALCGLAGWWDATTDTRKWTKEHRNA